VVSNCRHGNGTSAKLAGRWFARADKDIRLRSCREKSSEWNGLRFRPAIPANEAGVGPGSWLTPCKRYSWKLLPWNLSSSVRAGLCPCPCGQRSRFVQLVNLLIKRRKTARTTKQGGITPDLASGYQESPGGLRIERLDRIRRLPNLVMIAQSESTTV
jgi:hypothetical protein